MRDALSPRRPLARRAAPLAVALALVPAATATTAPASQPSARERAVAIDAVRVSPPERFVVERLARGLARPWSLAFLPGGGLLIVEKHGGVRVWSGGRLSEALAGGPQDVYADSDSGLLDVVLAPDHERSGLIYLAFAEGSSAANRTAIYRARFDGRRLLDGRVIFRSHPDKAGPGHPGGRLLFLEDGTLLLTVGDGFEHRDAAQDLGSDLGKILRLTRDGDAAAGNPFVGRAGARPEIWTLGHRNVQGLARDPTTGELWSHEHGPRGGDEMNLLRGGANYGWPVVTHGIDYDGSLISERAHAAGIERSQLVWSPSIAPSGLAIYGGDAFAGWKGSFLVGGLASQSLVRVERGRQTGHLVERERILGGLGARIRDVREGPDGLLYVLTDAENGELLRVSPR